MKVITNKNPEWSIGLGFCFKVRMAIRKENGKMNAEMRWDQVIIK